MKIGINTFLFTSPFTDSSTTLFGTFKKWGFDFVEIALEDPSDIDAAFIKKELEKNELTCLTICAAMGPERDLRGTKEQQQTAVSYLKGVMDQMVLIDCPMLVGPLYSSVGKADQVPAEEYKEQWATVVFHLSDLCNYARERNLTLAIEPLNRFETDFINTCEQGLQMIKDVNHPSLLLHLDSFHMNIEEKYLGDAILKAGEKLGHFHACGSDRGTPGNDHTDWASIFRAFKEINYQGNIAIESFTKDVTLIAKAASIWRSIEKSNEEIAEKGVQFLRQQLVQYIDN
jgi:D-psicose/D-tagatose/L-ribulose 3-epimerase